jgi:hypothetical protein
MAKLNMPNYMLFLGSECIASPNKGILILYFVENGYKQIHNNYKAFKTIMLPNNKRIIKSVYGDTIPKKRG